MSHLAKVATEEWRRERGPPPVTPMLFELLYLRAHCTDFKKFGHFIMQSKGNIEVILREMRFVDYPLVNLRSFILRIGLDQISNP